MSDWGTPGENAAEPFNSGDDFGTGDDFGSGNNFGGDNDFTAMSNVSEFDPKSKRFPVHYYESLLTVLQHSSPKKSLALTSRLSALLCLVWRTSTPKQLGRE
jgi:hypothetical protein